MRQGISAPSENDGQAVLAYAYDRALFHDPLSFRLASDRRGSDPEHVGREPNIWSGIVGGEAGASHQ